MIDAVVQSKVWFADFVFGKKILSEQSLFVDEKTLPSSDQCHAPKLPKLSPINYSLMPSIKSYAHFIKIKKST